MAKKLGCAIHGAGWVAGEHLKAYRANPHCEVVAVSSRRAEGARQCAAYAGCGEAAIYTSLDDLLADDRVDVVSICTPHDLHASEAIRAVGAGKHVLIEKPLCTSVEDMRAMRDAVRAAGVKTLVSFCLRWNPLFHNIRCLLDQGAIGRVFYAEVDYWNGITPSYAGYSWIITRRQGGSALLAAGCHAVDALRYFVGSEAVEVSAYSVPASSDTPWEYDPTMVLTVRFANGAVGKVSACLDTPIPYSFNINLLGSEGAIRNDRVFSTRLFPHQTDYATVPTIQPTTRDVTHHPFVAEVAALVDAIRLDHRALPDLEDAVRTHEICFGAAQSAETGRPVALPLLGD